MADKTPVRYAYDGSSLTGIAEYATSDTVGVPFGGTGATSLTDNGILIGNATSAIQVTSALTTNGQIVIGGTSGPAVANISGTSNEVEITNADGTITIGLPSALCSTGTLEIGGNVSFDGGSFVFNDAGADKDFRIEGDTNTELFIADASTDRIGIGTLSPTHLLDVNGVANVSTCVVTPKLCIPTEGFQSGYVLPAVDGSAGQIMCTDGSGALAFATATAGVTLAGSTNNTIATVTGANALAGEANLTFDGSTLAVAGALTATGNVSFDGGSFVFNEAGADKDFRIEGDTQANLFFADASTDSIGIGTNAPASSLIGDTTLLQIYGAVPALGLKSSTSSSTHEGTFAVDGAGLYIESGGHATASGNNFIKFRTEDSDGSFTATDRMIITNDGKIGIGTVAPDVLLHLEQGTDTTTGTLPSARFERTGASQTGVVLRSNGIDGLILRADSAGFGAIHSYEDLGFYTGATPGSSYGNVRMRIETTSANAQGTGVTFIDCCANYVVIGGLPPTGSHGLWIGWDNGSDQGIVNGIHTGTEWKPIGLSQNANLCINAGAGYTAFGSDWGRIVTCKEGGACSRFIINVCSDSATAPMAYWHNRGMCMSGCLCLPYCICANTCIGSPTKNFEIEHPLASYESPNKYNMMHLVHSTLEGPEYGVYYRGSAQLSGGSVKVDLPEYFEALAEKTDATVQLTPVGGISNLTVKLTDDSVLGSNSFCVCTDDSGDQAQCFHWTVNGRRIDKHILCNIAQGDRPGACDDGRLCVTRWEYRGEMENINGLESMNCAELDDLINFNNTWDSNDPDFVTGYETASKANKIIMIGNAFEAIQNSAEGGKTDFSKEEEE